MKRAFEADGIAYRAGRLTKDIDILVRREDLPRITEAVQRFGLQYRQTAGAHMLVQEGQPSARRAVHLMFEGEKVRADYLEPTPKMQGRSCRAYPS